MIDNPDQVIRVIARMREALPLSAVPSPELLGVVRRQSPGKDVPHPCHVTRVDYAGDEGGIMCGLDFGGEDASRFFVSITHLTFLQAAPLAREIAAYQKHRIKRLRHLGVPRGHAAEYSAR